MLILSITPAIGVQANIFPGLEWMTAEPAEVGLDSVKIEEFARAVGGDGVIVRHGRLVKSWGDPTKRKDWASASKPMMSTLLFFAIKEGRVPSVDSRVASLVERIYKKEVIAKDRDMTWRHLANMTSGYSLGERPGEAWAYNDYAITLYSHLLFDGVFGIDPAGIDAMICAPERLGRLQPQDGGFFGSRQGRGMNASPRDAARIGLFWLHRGNWNGRQLLPREYFDRYMRNDVPSDLPRTDSVNPPADYLGTGTLGGPSDQCELGPGVYGFNWWFNNRPRGKGEPLMPALPPDAFRADGHFGREVILVVPSLDLVVAARGDWGGLRASKTALLMEAVIDPPDRPLPGQIVRDPVHPQWLKRANGDAVFISGPGDPEDFLYRGIRNPDGTRSGDQAELIAKLIQHGGNSIYLQAIRSHGGDGTDDHNPFVDGDPERGLNEAILDQWEGWFRTMDEAGIVIYFFLYDDGARIWPGEEVGQAEEKLIQALIDRFKHHRNLIWLVGEEALEAYPVERVRAIAARIAHHDDHGHLVGSHGHSTTRFADWQEGGALDHYSMQFNTASSAGVHAAAVDARRNAEAAGASGHGYQVIYSENTERRENGPAALDELRAYLWDVAMAGVMPMRLGMDIAHTPAEALAACRIQQRFFESVDCGPLSSRDALAAGGTAYVLADPGRSYVAYGRSASDGLGLRGLAGGIYDLRWLDVVTGRTLDLPGVEIATGDAIFVRPPAIGVHCAVWARLRVPAAGPGLLTFVEERVTVEPEDGYALLTVRRIGGSQGAASVKVAPAGDITSPGLHPDRAFGVLQWADGERSDRSLRIPLPRDEKSGSVACILINPEGAALGAITAATVEIAGRTGGNLPPRASGQEVRVVADGRISIALTYADPDNGPAPYAFEIIRRPAHGRLTGKGNDRLYAPAPGFTGKDSFTWRVRDGAGLASDPATVSILVGTAETVGPSESADRR